MVRIEALKGKIFNFNENNENHRVCLWSLSTCYLYIYVYGVPLLLRNQSNILQVRYNDQIADDMTVQPSSPGPLDKWMERLPPEVTEHVELKKLIIPGKYTLRQKLSTTLYFYRYIFVYINTVKTIK